MKWIKFKDRSPNNGEMIFITLNGGVYGEWRDKLWPDQAYFSCSCGDINSEGIEVGDLQSMGISWCEFQVPLPKDDE